MWSKIAAAPPSQAAIRQGTIQKPPAQQCAQVVRAPSKPPITLNLLSHSNQSYQSNLFFTVPSKRSEPPIKSGDLISPTKSISEATIPPGLSKNARRKLRKQLAQAANQSTTESSDQPIPAHTTAEPSGEVTSTPAQRSQIVRGIVNTGNICFMNTVLQVLLACSPMYSLFEYLSKYSISSKYQKLVVMNNFVDDYQAGQAHLAYHPAEMIQLVKQFSGSHGGPQQQEDAPEFLNWLLDGLHEEFISLANELGGDPSQVFKILKNSVPEAVTDDGWEEVGKNNQVSTIHRVQANESPISSIFRSQIRNTIRQRAKNASHIQPYYCIPLDIVSDDILTLDDALRAFLSRGSIQQISASSQMSIDGLPPILTIHLARFTVVQSRCRKISKFLSFPSSLQIRKAYLAPNFQPSFPSQTSEELKYSLFAVISHHGTTIHNGHYTCDIFDRTTKQWLACNDEQVIFTTENEVLGRNAYMLFYQQL